MDKKKEQKLFALMGGNSAFVHLRVGFDGAGYKVRVPETVSQPAATATNLRAGVPSDAALSEPDFANPADVQPQDADYIYPVFRALSAAITRPSMEGLVLDFTMPGVIEAAAGKLAGQTVYKNHWSWDVEDYLGVVNTSVYDATGDAVEGVPGINAELKIDQRIAPKIARGLLMSPPAINAVSVQVFFTFEYSHPELADKGVFWRMMGEEVDGSLVRLIATEITGFGELSLVNRGADKYNRRLPDMPSADDANDYEDGTPSPDDAEAETGKKKKTGAGMAAPAQPPNQAKGEKTVKLSPEMIAALGLQGDQATEFAESVVLNALPAVTAKAALGDSLLTQLREETTAVALRAAALTHKGDGEPKLDVRDALLIGKADASELVTLKTAYESQVAASLSATCQKCGATVTSLQSSVMGTTTEPVADVPRVNVV